MSEVLVTGGTGYIGSHTALELINNNNDIIIIDNLSNSSIKVIDRLNDLSNTKINFIKGDIRDIKLLKSIFNNNNIKSVIHFAGLKSVKESVHDPISYYDNNVGGTLSLLEVMDINKVNNLVFSSSATVYGIPKTIPITENVPIGNTKNPYGTSKYFVEKILNDIYLANKKWSMVILRYFNPIGAHSSGKIGDNPNGIPNNLLPYICQVAIGKLKALSIFGNDYNTKDGTGVRDYIHVVDLSISHVKALKKHFNDSGLHIYNIGTGKGYSVLDIIKSFEKVSNTKIPFNFVPRRDGDIDSCYSNCDKANKILNWQAKKDLNDMLLDAWNWQKNNPNGYD